MLPGIVHEFLGLKQRVSWRADPKLNTFADVGELLAEQEARYRFGHSNGTGAPVVRVLLRC